MCADTPWPWCRLHSLRVKARSVNSNLFGGVAFEYSFPRLHRNMIFDTLHCMRSVSELGCMGLPRNWSYYSSAAHNLWNPCQWYFLLQSISHACMRSLEIWGLSRPQFSVVVTHSLIFVAGMEMCALAGHVWPCGCCATPGGPPYSQLYSTLSHSYKFIDSVCNFNEQGCF